MSDTTVSLPAHLRSTLVPLTGILPKNLCERLSPSLIHPCTEISHSLLLDISKWSRTEEGRSQLLTQALEPSDFSMISLLAGTITSPSSKFPPYVPTPDAAEQARRTTNDRKAITAMLNGLLSIGGAAYAGWWASSRMGWINEWRALFTLLVASVVAVSEGILYLIWQSGGIGRTHGRVMPRVPQKSKEGDTSGEDCVDEIEVLNVSDGLRRRQARLLDD